MADIVTGSTTSCLANLIVFNNTFHSVDHLSQKVGNVDYTQVKIPAILAPAFNYWILHYRDKTWKRAF